MTTAYRPTRSQRVDDFFDSIPRFIPNEPQPHDAVFARLDDEDEPIEDVGERHVYATDYWRERT